MGAKTEIAWTDHTFQPWWGCQRVSPGCENCYAERFDHRLGGNHWGPKAARRFFGDKHWAEPLKWDRAAAAAGVRKRVFCASMADVFEDRWDLDLPRARLWELIRATPHLDWQLLTKRPENLMRMLPWTRDAVFPDDLLLARDPWPNVWIGTTVEDQKRANDRLPILACVPAAVRFVSAEPLLEKVDLRTWLEIDREPARGPDWIRSGWRPEIDWVIIGGESGHGARRFDTTWADVLVEQCRAAGTAVFVKQLGDHVTDGATWARIRNLAPKGSDIDEFPTNLQIREFPPRSRVDNRTAYFAP